MDRVIDWLAPTKFNVDKSKIGKHVLVKESTDFGTITWFGKIVLIEDTSIFIQRANSCVEEITIQDFLDEIYKLDFDDIFDLVMKYYEL